MSTQKRVDSFFSTRKRASDQQHAAKKRKLILEEKPTLQSSSQCCKSLNKASSKSLLLQTPEKKKTGDVCKVSPEKKSKSVQGSPEDNGGKSGGSKSVRRGLFRESDDQVSKCDLEPEQEESRSKLGQGSGSKSDLEESKCELGQGSGSISDLEQDEEEKSRTRVSSRLRGVASSPASLVKTPTKDREDALKIQAAISRVLSRAEANVSDSMVTCALDNHQILDPSTPSSSLESKNLRTHKRDSFGRSLLVHDSAEKEADSKQKKVLFTQGTSNAKKKLDLSYGSCLKKNNVPFSKLGSLSPSKSSVSKLVAKSTLSPNNHQILDETRLSPAEVKKKLGSTNSLQALQERLKSIQKSPAAKSKLQAGKARRELFAEEPRAPGPTLKKEGLTLELSLEQRPRPAKSPIKASPRKEVTDKTELLKQPSVLQPLPFKYQELSLAFRTLDGLVAIRFNRNQSIPMASIRQDVQRAMGGKVFTDRALKQILIVLPSAYVMSWESKRDSRGRPLPDYELHIKPGLAPGLKLTPKVLIDRDRQFKHSLFTIVQDHHDEFLRRDRGFSEELVPSSAFLNKWDTHFDPDMDCSDIDEAALPAKPNVAKPVTDAKTMLAKITELTTPNKLKLKGMVLDDKRVVETPKKEEAVKDEEQVKVHAQLRGLSPMLIAKITARDKEKRLRDMTMMSSERKELSMLEELLHNRFFSSIVNHHKTFRKGAAVPIDVLAKKVSDSCSKSKNEAMELLKLFIKVCPNVLAVKIYNKVEMVLAKYDKTSPAFDAMERVIKHELETRQKSKDKCQRSALNQGRPVDCTPQLPRNLLFR